MERTEYGFTRTPDCACRECAKYCREMPGFLNPADLRRMSNAMGYKSIEDFADENLLASPGAVVAQNGKIFRIHTLVPAKQNGGCKFLDDRQLCTIHEVSPFGCAFFDPHEKYGKAVGRSSYALFEIMDDFKTGGPYSTIWNRLNAAGKTATDPLESTKKLWGGGR